MAHNIIKVENEGGILVVDSRLIADRLGITHKSFMETVYKFQARVEQRFGQLRFKTETVRNSVGALNDIKIVMLTKPQAEIYMTFSRNTEQVIECKLDLVEAFNKAESSIGISLTPTDQMAQLMAQSQQMLLQTQQMMLHIAAISQQQGIQVATISEKVAKIESVQEDAIASLDEIAQPEVEAEELTTRAKLNRLVRDYSAANALHFHEVWRRVYREFKDRYHTDLSQRAKNIQANGGKKFGALDVCEQLGKIEELYATAYDLLKV